MLGGEGPATSANMNPADSVSTPEVLEELRKAAVPRYRQPGVCRRKRIICSESEWERALQQLKDAMGEYRALGFDVECIDVNNHRQQHYFQNQQEVDRELPNHFHRAPTMDHVPPRYRQQHQELQDRCSASPSLAVPSEYAEGDDDGQYRNQTKPKTLLIPILPTPQSTKHHKEISVLIQLATWSGLVIMLRLCFWRSIPDSLREFLSDARYLKLGVGIDQDATRLLDDWGLVLRGWIDLRHLCIDLRIQFRDYCFMRQMGLKKLAEGLFGATVITLTMPMGLKKMRSIAWSDWNAVRLKEDQIRYAAWDAQIAVDIFSFMTQRLFSMGPPQRESRNYFDALYEKCIPFIGIPKSRRPRGDDDDDSDEYEDDYLNGDEEDTRVLYDNCRMFAVQTGNRGFRSGPVALPGLANLSADVAVMGTDYPNQTPALTIHESLVAPSAISVESNVGSALERRPCEGISIAFVNKKCGIAILTINNSPKNVLDFATVKSMIGNFRLLEDTKDCRAVILASACSNAFSVGFDLNEFRNADPKRLRAYWAALMDLWFIIYKTRLSTVAAINGIACAGGFMMAACCDRRIMAAGCGGVGFTEAKLGIALPHWAMARIAQIIGPHRAETILTRGQILDAELALEYGLVDRVTSKDRLLDAATDELEKLLDIPDYPRVNIKWMMRQHLIDKILHERERNVELMAGSVSVPPTQELIRRALIQKSK